MNADWVPLEITPADVGVKPCQGGLIRYLNEVANIDEQLVESKALLFRGFKVQRAGIDEVLDNILRDRLAYLHGNTPRVKVGKDLYTSTEYPKEYAIWMHSELSYAHAWPSRLAFYCERPAEAGGATPLVDCERWLAALDSDIRNAFVQGVRYTQNLHGGMGFGKSWQSTFETDNRAKVEEFLSQSNANWEWRENGGLRIVQRRPSTVKHPVTGVEVWFNQADQWHPVAGLDDETATALAGILPEDEFPQSVSLADGTPIPAQWAIQIRERGLESAIDIAWETGDVLLIDNVLVAHGRRPFTGDRRILVAMSN
ncbi:TauD/TfdA family dioxygenase [Streptomyces sp. NPDC021218]|uniref:TauD/TfdA family dioxygenase n=1 Tax=Streptomyces sp. NPDC021218 TaxID=3365119 RepID=UPI00378858B6